MSLRAAVLVALAVLAAGGCGSDDPPPLDAACTESPEIIERALDRAPGTVTLAGGTRLSDCVSRARSDADLQDAGLVLTGAADHLAVRARRGDVRAAIGLGYLVGAAKRGAARTPGLQAQLARRMEAAAAFVDDGGPAVAAAIRRGVRAGQATG